MIGGGGGIILGICLAGGHPKTALLVTGLCAYSWGALLVEAGSRLPALVRRIHYRRWEGRYYALEPSAWSAISAMRSSRQPCRERMKPESQGGAWAK